MDSRKKLTEQKIKKLIEEFRLELRNIYVSKHNYIFDLSKAINMLMTIIILEKLVEDIDNFNRNCYLFGFTPEKIYACINNKKIIIFDVENILRFCNYFNTTFGDIKKLAIKNIMLNSNLITIKGE